MLIFKTSKIKGFTLTEVLVSLVIITMIISVVFYSLTALKNSNLLNKKASEVRALLEQARYLSITNNKNNCYGIKVLTTSLVLFSAGSSCTTDYNVSATGNKILLLDAVVADLLALPDSAGTKIVFKKTTGEIYYGTTGSLRLHLLNNLTKTITININQAGIISQ